MVLWRLGSGMGCLSPPSNSDAPSMNNALVTIAPAMDALTKILTGAQRSQSDEQFGQITECGVEQPTDGVAGFVGDRFRGEAEQRGQWHNREDRQH